MGTLVPFNTTVEWAEFSNQINNILWSFIWVVTGGLETISLYVYIYITHTYIYK